MCLLLEGCVDRNVGGLLLFCVFIFCYSVIVVCGLKLVCVIYCWLSMFVLFFCVCENGSRMFIFVFRFSVVVV